MPFLCVRLSCFYQESIRVRSSMVSKILQSFFLHPSFHIRAPPMFVCLTPSQRRPLSQNYQKLPVSSAPPTDPGGFGRPIHRYSPTTSLCLERNSTSAGTASEGRQALAYYTGRIENFERCVGKKITILRRRNAIGCSLHGFLWLYASGRVYRELRSSIRRFCSLGSTRR